MKSSGKNKVCSHCRKSKRIDGFYKNRSTIDGLEYQCKICSKETGKRWRKRNPDIVRDLKRKWRKKNVEKNSSYHKNWRYKNREYNNYTHLARKKLHYAIEIGKIKRLPCVVCGNVKSCGHHEDYSKPLEVIWLCAKHHHLLHSGKLNLKNG